MTARELYDTDPGFRGFLACWDQDRRCPLELVDYLLDWGMESQAECARWAATEKKRRVYAPLTEHGERTSPCGPYPTMNRVDEWFWSGYFNETSLGTAETVYFMNLGEGGSFGYGSSAIDSIVKLMDMWIISETLVVRGHGTTLGT